MRSDGLTETARMWDARRVADRRGLIRPIPPAPACDTDDLLDVHGEGDELSPVVEHGVVVGGVEGDRPLAVAIRQDRH